PTVVAWDAGTSGRTEIFAEYKAQRRSRPDLLKEQWPAMEPLVEAFGYTNVRVEGYEADDVIATIATRALEASPPVGVMIVTGDRDVFQLIDGEGVVKVMATARGITETKIYDERAVIERYGIAPGQIPDFYGLKGDTSDNIPGVRGIGEKTASELIRRFGSLEGVLGHVDEINGPKRRESLIEQAQAARISKELAAVRRDVELGFDPLAEVAHEPDRSRLREFFREYELRDPLRRLEEALEDAGAASLSADGGASGVPGAGADTEADGGAPTRLTAHVRAGGVREIAELGEEGGLRVVARAGEVPEGALFGEGPWRFAVACGEDVLIGECAGPREVVEACGVRAVVAHDAKALDLVPPGLAHDTLLGAYLLEPARRGYPFAELCEERGFSSEMEDALARDAVMLGALAEWQREQISELELEGVMREIELPLVAVLRAMEEIGVRLDCARLAEITGRVREEISELEGEIFALAGEEFLIASPQQLGEVLFEKLGLSRRRRGKTGYST
ncbi:MAG TPA: DNA polymerase, partial [Solirubrobacteraceae bacterium]|nr:DNA polymerase [Solirubrobacteraceae bacterium]